MFVRLHLLNRVTVWSQETPLRRLSSCCLITSVRVIKGYCDGSVPYDLCSFHSVSLWLSLPSSRQSFSFIWPSSLTHLSLLNMWSLFSKVPVWLNTFHFLFQPNRITFYWNLNLNVVVSGVWDFLIVTGWCRGFHFSVSHLSGIMGPF